MSDINYKDPTPNNFPNDYDKNKVDPRVKIRSNSIKTKMYGEHTREAMVQGIEISSVDSSEAKKISKETKKRLDNEIIGLTSDSEIIDFRRSERLGYTFPILKERGDFWDKEFDVRGVNAKWRGAISDCNYLSNDSIYYADKAMSIPATDNSEILNKVADYCRYNNLPFYLPPGKYLIKEPLDLRDIKYIKIEGEIIASKSMSDVSVVKIGSSTSDMIRGVECDISLSNETYKGTDSGLTGVEFINIVASKLNVNKSMYFKRAVSVSAKDINNTGKEIGNAWNYYYFNSLQHNKIGIHLQNHDENSYVNENYFVGSQCSGNEMAIKIGENYSFEPLIHNHNRFFGSFEKNDIGIKTWHAHRNYIENARFEETKIIAEFNDNSKFNFIYVGHEGSDIIVDNTAEKTNRIYRLEKFFNTNSQVPSISFKYATHIKNQLIIPNVEFCDRQDGKLRSFKHDSTQSLVDKQGVKISSHYAIGKHFTTINNKRLDLKMSVWKQIKDDNKMFYVIKPYNSSGLVINDDENCISSVSQYGTNNGYWTTSFGGAYLVPFTNKYWHQNNQIILSDKVQACFIGISAGSGDESQWNYVQGFSVLSDSNTTLTTDYLMNEETVAFNNDVFYASSPPLTGIWKRGQMLYNTFFEDKTCVGWVCIDAGNVGTWKKFGILE